MIRLTKQFLRQLNFRFTAFLPDSSKITHANKPNSYERIRYSCQPLIDFFGEKRVDRIGIKDIENFIVRCSAQKSKKTGLPMTRDSINLELATLKAIFKRLTSEKYLIDNPAKDLKRLAQNERNFHVLTNEEEKIYLMACPQPLQDVATLMLETGMRPSEVYKLPRRNVFLEKEYLQIENSKTRSSNRKIWLSDKAADILCRRLEKFKGEYLFPAGDVDGRPPIRHLNRSHRETTNRIGLDFRLYDCRHSFANRAL